MEIKLNVTAEQAEALLAAARAICKTTPDETEAAAFQALIDGIQAPPAGYWTRSVQVSLTTTTDEPVTDTDTARGILADLFIPGLIFTEDIDNEGDGIYLTSVPAELYQEASEEGGAVVSHSGGYILEIPMD